MCLPEMKSMRGPKKATPVLKSKLSKLFPDKELQTAAADFVNLIFKFMMDFFGALYGGY